MKLSRKMSVALVLVTGLLCSALVSGAGEISLAEAQRRLKTEAEDANALFSLSFYFEKAGRPFSALRATERAIEIEKKVPGYYARRGQLLMARRRIREAAEAYGKAADMDPKTKSFRAAEARALTACDLLKRASRSWKLLLDGTEDRKEVLDAARQLAAVKRRMNDLAGAEQAWTVAHGKLTNWSDQMSAADQVSSLMVARGQPQRAVAFWKAIFEAQEGWKLRAPVADRLSKVSRGASKDQVKLLATAEKCWVTLLSSAGSGYDRQRAATALAEIRMAGGRAAEAVKVLRPQLFAAGWHTNFRAAEVLHRAYTRLGQAGERRKLWAELVARSGNYSQRSQAVGRLVAITSGREKVIEIHRATLKDYPKEITAHKNLASALIAAEKYLQAADAYSAAIPAVKRQKHYRVYNIYWYWQRMADLCCRAGRPDLAVGHMKTSFATVADPWQVSYWLGYVRSRCGEYAALNAAGELAGLKGIRRLGAGEYLARQSGAREDARVILTAAAGDASLKVDYRHRALDRLLNIARTGDERIDLARRKVALGGSYWQRRSSYRTLTMWLARAGRIREGCDAVRSADKVRQNRSVAGPNALYYLGRYLFNGNRVGPALRSTEGLVDAEKAARELYAQFGRNKHYTSNFNYLLGNLAELHARRGDYAGAVELLHGFCKANDTQWLRLKAADLLDRKDAKDKSAAFTEYLAYVDVAVRDYARGMRRWKRKNYYRYSTPGINGQFLGFLSSNKQDNEFIKAADERLARFDGLEREALARFVIAFYRNRARPEDLKKFVVRVRGMGLDAGMCKHHEQWADAAIKMKNSKSQADTRRRDRLLKEAARWKDALARNGEDYGAAVNAYKIYQLLGRQKDADPYLKRALKISPSDPLIMERYARELMLTKSYAGAANMMVKAAKITGRRTDYEQQMVSAFALAGKGRDALDLALDSLVKGRHNGRGVRSVEQILDMANRANQEKFLHARLKKTLGAAAKAGKPMRDEVVRLALRVAWDRADAELSKLAVDELVRIVRDPSRHWRNQWRLTQLANKAKERRRLEDSARIRGAMLSLKAAQGYGPNVYEYRQLAMLFIEAGKPESATELMFDGLSRAGQGGAALHQHRPIPGPWERRRPRGKRIWNPGGAGVAASRQVRLPWITAILEMAAREAESGADEFRKACGKRLAALKAEEMTELKKSPARYSGPLVNSSVAEGLKLREKVTAEFRAAAAGNKATSRDHLALARRLVSLSSLPLKRRPKGLNMAEITASCDAAVKSAAKDAKAKTHIEVGRLYRQLLYVTEKDRLAGARPELALAHFEAAAASMSGKWGLDALREALNLARQHKLQEQALAYARKLNAAFPKDAGLRRTLAESMLAAGKIADALTLLRSGLGKHAVYGEYQSAGDACMRSFDAKPVAARAAAGAVDFYREAIAIYLREVGKQVDAKGKPLADRTLGYIQTSLSRAHAAEGQPEKALEALVASIFNRGGDALDVNNVELVAKAYAKAGKTEKFLAAMAARVKQDPKSFKLRLAYAAALSGSGKFAAAASALRAARVIKPELSTVKRLIEVLRKAKLHRQALAECKAWAASFPRDAEAYRVMAAVYKDLGNKQGEVRALTMLVEVAPREAANCRQVAVLFAERKEYERAVGLMQRAMELRPEEPYRHIDLAEVLYMSEEFERAGKICRAALERDWTKGLAPELMARMPDPRGTYETRAHSLLGDIYEKLKKKAAAAKSRLNVPAGYKRPKLKNAVPAARRRRWWPRPIALRGGRRRIIE
jgi:tetratricopeptide (TPR) repeat protein